MFAWDFDIKGCLIGVNYQMSEFVIFVGEEMMKSVLMEHLSF